MGESQNKCTFYHYELGAAPVVFGHCLAECLLKWFKIEVRNDFMKRLIRDPVCGSHTVLLLLGNAATTQGAVPMGTRPLSLEK